MNLFKKGMGTALVLVAGLLAGGVATATPITMDFDGLTPATSVHTYYDGGCTAISIFSVDCGGPDYGVVWKDATVGTSPDAPAPAAFAAPFLTGQATMNVVAGFEGGLSLSYYNLSNLVIVGGVSVYSGLDGGGTLLAYADLGETSDWDFFSLAFAGTAQSAVFQGFPVFLSGFDDVTLNVNAPTNPVPEPATLGVFGLGLLLMGLFAGLRRRHN